MKILIIDNTIDPDSWGAKDLCHLAQLTPDATVYVRRAPEQDLPASPKEYDRIILSGSKTSAMDLSPWVGQLMDFIQKTLNEKIPFLGVCFGHQILVRTLGGIQMVRKSQIPEFGWTEIHTIGSSPFMKGIPPTFYSFSAHFEEVSQLPAGMKNLAKSQDCEIQACQLENFPVFGIQFHPEKTPDEAEKVFLARKKEKNPKISLNPDRTTELYNANIGKTLIKNFLEGGYK